MSSIMFVLIGLAACGFTRGLFNDSLPGLLLDLCLGVAGAVVAGSLFRHISGADAATFSVASGLVALAGAAAVLASYHCIFPGIHRRSGSAEHRGGT
jgi:uncharacterized membrane protein YeaQ/YmgE (transglycosylase-associated protein family)